MKAKRPIDSRRCRTVPESFGWVDHRLVRNGWIKKCGKDALALYLFLITVSDADGLSYYSDEKTSYLLSMSRKELESARSELLRAGWLLWNGWLYQVLDLGEPPRAAKVHHARCGTGTIGSVLADMAREACCD